MKIQSTLRFIVGAGPDGVGVVPGGGGENNPDAGNGQQNPAGGGQNPDGEPAKVGPNGFPLNTAVVDMTADQQIAYYKFHSRKHEDRAKALESGLTKAEAEALRTELEALKTEKLSDQEKAVKKAVDEARAAAKQEAEADLLPRLHRSEIKSIAATVLDKDRLNTWLSVTDLKAFVGDNGDIDEGKVIGTLTALYGEPESKGGQQSNDKYKDWGQGRGGGSQTSKWDVGKAAAAKRYGNKKS